MRNDETNGSTEDPPVKYLTPAPDSVSLEVSCDPSSWEVEQDKIPVLLVGINSPRYTSLPIRLLVLYIRSCEELKSIYDLRFLEVTTDMGIEGVVNAIAAWNPPLVGMSVNIWNQQSCIDLSHSIKQVSPDSTILCGGQEVTRSLVDYLQEVASFDYLIDGEGELPLKQFLENWQTGSGLKNVSEVSGLWYRDGSVSRLTRPADVVDDLDALPSVVCSDLVPANPNNVLGVMLEGTRGCPFRCAFCFEGYRKCKVRSASVGRLVEELEYMARRGARFFHILDPIFFNSNLARLQEIADAMRELRQRYDFSISIEAYADQINEENIEFFGLFSVLDLGLQSINPETLKAINRRYSPEKFEKGLALLRETRATTNIYLISGLPYETAVTFLKGILFIIAKRPTRIFCNELLLLNGTELRERADEYGYKFNPLPPYNVYSSNWISEVELQSIQMAATTVGARYNLTSRASYSDTPGFSEQDGFENDFFAYRGGCRHQCKGCLNRVESTASERLGAMNIVLSKELDRLDIRCGTDFDTAELFHVLAHTHLADINYLQLIAPCDAPIDMGVVCELFRYSVLHYKIYLTADGGRTELTETERSTMETLTSIIKYGLHHQKPFLEVVLFAGDSDPDSYMALAETISSYTPQILTVVDDRKTFNDRWRAALVEFFPIAREKQMWLKLGANEFGEVFRGSPDRPELISLLDTLDLVAPVTALPPCHVAGVEK